MGTALHVGRYHCDSLMIGQITLIAGLTWLLCYGTYWLGQEVQRQRQALREDSPVTSPPPTNVRLLAQLDADPPPRGEASGPVRD